MQRTASLWRQRAFSVASDEFFHFRENNSIIYRRLTWIYLRPRDLIDWLTWRNSKINCIRKLSNRSHCTLWSQCCFFIRVFRKTRRSNLGHFKVYHTKPITRIPVVADLRFENIGRNTGRIQSSQWNARKLGHNRQCNSVTPWCREKNLLIKKPGGWSGVNRWLRIQMPRNWSSSKFLQIFIDAFVCVRRTRLLWQLLQLTSIKIAMATLLHKAKRSPINRITLL